MGQTAKPKINSLTFFFPCYNDKGTIGKLIDDSAAVVQKLGIDDFEVIVTDDGSTDGAHELLEELLKTKPFLRVVFHEKNRGYGAALRSGFGQATKDWIFYTDGDGQYDVKEVALLVDALEEGVDLVNGYKMKRQDTFDRIIIGKIYQWAMKAVFLLKIRDVDCDYRLFRRAKLEEVVLKSEDGSMCVELSRRLQNAGAVIRQVPVHHFSRVYGHSQFFTFRRVAKTLFTLLKLWWELVLLGRTK
jgi:glycosyltransferase involved in cell wall biosynthesis